VGSLYFQHRFTVRRSAAETRTVTCEKCCCEYQYELAREVPGHAISPYGLFDASAVRRAERCAQRRLEKIMPTAVDSVPCPQCGWIQAHMVREARRWRYSDLRTIALVILGFALTAMGVAAAAFSTDSSTTRDEWRLLLLWTGVPALAALVALVVRWALVRAWDPNLRRLL